MMILTSINWVAVLVASVASMVLGFVWFGPLFGKQWALLAGYTEAEIEEGKKKGGMGATYFMNFVSALITMAALQFLFQKLGVESASLAIKYAFGLWLGFFATAKYGGIMLWGKNKSWTLFWIESGYQLVQLVVAALIFVSL